MSDAVEVLPTPGVPVMRMFGLDRDMVPIANR
jgi:hypothetical protein